MPIQVISELAPKNGGQFALLDDKFIRGGFHVCANLTERNNIPADIRKYGMRVFVQSNDIVYMLGSDLVTWIIDSSTTNSLQQAYDGGNQIEIVDGSPFLIKNGTSTLFSISSDGTLEFTDTLKGKDYTSNITQSVNTSSVDIIVDITDKTKYRAVQYNYTITNSDNSGFETGQLYLIHNGLSCSLCAIIGNAIGTSCGAIFNAVLSGYNLELTITTDNSIAASRIVHLFKIALT